MAKVHQRKTKKQRSLQQEDKDQEHSGSELGGLHYPAVAVAYRGAANSAPVVQNKQNPSQLVEEGKKQQTTSPYQYHVPAQFAAVSPVQRNENGGAGLSTASSSNQTAGFLDLFKGISGKHLLIKGGIEKNKKIFEEGNSMSVSFFGLSFEKEKTLDYKEVIYLIAEEQRLYEKIKLNNITDERHPDYAKYTTIYQALTEKINQWDQLQKDRDKVDLKALQQVEEIYQHCVQYDRDKLFRILQLSFPYRSKVETIFQEKFGSDIYAFIKAFTRIRGDFDWSMAQAYLKAGKLRPADKFYIAVKGAGTDEGNVFFAMRQAYAIGVESIEAEYKEEYSDDLEGPADLPHTGNSDKRWEIAGRIDDDMDSDSDDNIKAKAILSFGKVRPVDEVRMALKGDISNEDLRKAFRKSAEEGLAGPALTKEYQRSFGTSLEGDMLSTHLKLKSGIFFTTVVVDQTALDKSHSILDGKESKVDYWLELINSDSKTEALQLFLKASKEDKAQIVKKVQLDLVNNTELKISQFNRMLIFSLYSSAMSLDGDPAFETLKSNTDFSKAGIEGYIKYNAKRADLDKLRNGHWKNQAFKRLIRYIGDNDSWGDSFFKTYQLEDYLEMAIKKGDREWASNVIFNVLDDEEKNRIKSSQKFKLMFYKYDARWVHANGRLTEEEIEKHSDKDLRKDITDLMNNDTEARIKAERKLLTKANSGLGSSITDMFSTSGLSAENEQRELEVDLEIAKGNDGKIDNQEKAGLEQEIQNARETRKNFEEVRDSVEGVATMIAQTIITVAAGALIPGAGAILAQAIINGITAVAVNKIMKNDRYTIDQAGKDLIMGAIDGGMGAFGSGAITKLAGSGSKFTQLALRNTIIKSVSEQAISNSHQLAIGLIQGKSAKESMIDYVKAIGTGVAMDRTMAKIGGMLKTKGPAEGETTKMLGEGEGAAKHEQEGQDQTNENGENKDNGDTDADLIVPHQVTDGRPTDFTDWDDKDILHFLNSPESGGSWDSAIKTLKKLDGGDKVIQKMEAFRNKIKERLAASDAKLLDDASTGYDSDMDFNISGDDAGAKLLKLDADLRLQYGDYEKKFKMNLYTDKSRLGQYNQLLSKGLVSEVEFGQIELEITALSDQFNLAKMLKHAEGDALSTARIEALITARSDEKLIRQLAFNYDALKAQKLQELHLAVDKMVTSLNNKHLKPIDQKRLSVEISRKQAEINFYTKEAYIGFGAMDKNKSPAMFHQAMTSQLEMIQHQIREYNGAGHAGKEYEIHKYIYRFITDLEKSGVAINDKLRMLKEVSFEIYNKGNSAETSGVFGRDIYQNYAPNRTPAQRAAVINGFLDEAFGVVASTMTNKKAGLANDVSISIHADPQANSNSNVLGGDAASNKGIKQPTQGTSSEISNQETLSNIEIAFGRELQIPYWKEKLEEIRRLPEGKVKNQAIAQLNNDLSELAGGKVHKIDNLPADTVIHSATDTSDYHFANQEYLALVASDRTREAALVYNTETNRYAWIQGHSGHVKMPKSSSFLQEAFKDLSGATGGGKWILVAHSHPSGSDGLVRAANRFPSGSAGDFAVIVRNSQRNDNQPMSSRIDYMTAKGADHTQFGFIPNSENPFWVNYVDPTTNIRFTKYFKTLEDYEAFMLQEFNVNLKRKS